MTRREIMHAFSNHECQDIEAEFYYHTVDLQL